MSMNIRINASQFLVRGLFVARALVALSLSCAEPEPERIIVLVERPPFDAGVVTDGGSDDRPGPVRAEEIPFYEAWRGSAHADRTSVAFNNWNKEGAVPTTCGRCHSSEGFIDFLGGDGSIPGQVDRPAPVQSEIRCTTCHNRAALSLTSVTFPSGAKVGGLGREATCMTCHQGRASGADVDKAIKTLALPDDDTASAALNFTNIHYYPAAATLYAGEAKSGYQYPGKRYDVRFRHVPEANTCIGCHDAHSSKIKIDLCATCHKGVKDGAGLRTIRMMSSVGRDYDGDGDVTEGVAGELNGSRDKLLAAMKRHGVERKAPLCYNAAAYPYWFADTNADGTCGADEALATNGYKAWTPRLLRAAFNYQLATKDPGAFAHNAKYIMELLYDSITDVNSAVAVKVDMSRSVRGDRGHFDGTGIPARNWDADDAVNATCSRCHSGEVGFRFFVDHGVSINVPETGNGLECGTCHAKVGEAWDLVTVKNTPFPGGKTLALGGSDNLCGTCHSGRVAKADLDAAIAAKDYKFMNVHYLPAAAVREGGRAVVGYEYAGKTYAGQLKHQGGIQCTSCHDPKASQHTFSIVDSWESRCKSCHADANGQPEKIRQVRLLDYDGDGKTDEPLAAELDGLAEKLLEAMAASAGPGGLCYSSATYPYFFKDADGDAKTTCGPSDAAAANRFVAWTPKLMKVAHNYQLSRKDPGAWAHNFDYVAQLLIDSIEDLGGKLAGVHRP